ncbi:hypothetical protein V6N13_061991 [Hibiscus sabdariffa]
MVACSLSHRDVADAFIAEALAWILKASPSALFDEMLITPLICLLENVGFSRTLSIGLKKLLNIQLLRWR